MTKPQITYGVIATKMQYSKLFTKTTKEAPKDEVSVNAMLLSRAGFIRKEMAGAYNLLPLGLRVLAKISNIVREEMNNVGGQEILMTALQNKSDWQQTGRWDSFDVLFKVQSRHDAEYALGPTHEEVVVPLVKQFVSSYRDLPISVYQIQAKFRDEERAKSGILRGREFLMKDLYSFHASEEDFEKYYEVMKGAYKRVFKRCGLSAIETEASGGAFSKFSHEFQVLAGSGEDTIFYCNECNFSQNKEIVEVKSGDKCPNCDKGLIKEGKAIEVGNIFPLKTRFSEAFDLKYKGSDGKEELVVMGCYGIGVSRLMGTIVEVHHDERGIIWPESVAPYQVHLAGVHSATSEVLQAQEVYKRLQKEGIEVLWDDREDISTGEKFADADLIGIPVRLVVSAKTQGKVEWKSRRSQDTELLSLDEVTERLKPHGHNS